MRTPVFVVAGVLLAAIGCTPADARYPLRGAVTVPGRAVPAGTILFQPLDPGGVQARAEIHDGRYDTAAAGGVNPKPGRYLIVVNGYESLGRSGDTPDGAPVFSEHSVEVVIPVGCRQYDIAVPVR